VVGIGSGAPLLDSARCERGSADPPRARC